jgi:hypothetical protein
MLGVVADLGAQAWCAYLHKPTECDLDDASVPRNGPPTDKAQARPVARPILDRHDPKFQPNRKWGLVQPGNSFPKSWDFRSVRLGSVADFQAARANVRFCQ